MGAGTPSDSALSGGGSGLSGGGSASAGNAPSDSASLRSRGPLAEPEPAGTNRWRGRGGRRWFWNLALGAVIIVGSLVGIVLLLGRVSGREFLPDRFEVRRFSFLEIPLLRIQVSPVRYTPTPSALARYLRTTGKVTPFTSEGEEVRGDQWHLVELRRGDGALLHADAKLLVDFLYQPADRSLSPAGTVGGGPARSQAGPQRQHQWHQWSLEHPAQAAVLWPRVQRLAHRRLYLLIPDLFRIAEETQSGPALRAAIDTLLLRRYEQMIAESQSAGQHALAESIRQAALADYPDDPRWQPGG